MDLQVTEEALLQRISTRMFRIELLPCIDAIKTELQDPYQVGQYLLGQLPEKEAAMAKQALKAALACYNAINIRNEELLKQQKYASIQ